MKPVDACGNILDRKDYVAVKLGGEVFQCMIVDIKESSLLLTDKKMIPGVLHLIIPWTIIFSNDSPRIPNVFKLVKPVGFEHKIPGVDLDKS